MEQQNRSIHHLELSIHNLSNEDTICKIGRAFSIPERLSILRLLQYKPMSVIEIAKTLNFPVSSTSFHINALEDAKLIFIDYQPGIKGHVKLCSKMILDVNLIIENAGNQASDVNRHIVEMPIGNYIDLKATPTCGIADEKSIIIGEDNPKIFFSPERVQAQLLWFQTGYVAYCFPNHFIPKTGTVKDLSFSLEICSEAPYFRNVWPSDITFWINGIEVVTYTSPGDFGGKHGKYTPAYWDVNSSQFGLLKTITVNQSGCYIDEALINRNITIDDLHLNENDNITLKIGIKEDAKYIGGVNIFGKKFGAYPQDIIMTVVY